MSNIKEAIAKAPKDRVRRTPNGTRNVLTVNGKDPNYVYRVVNDEGDRISQLEDYGYEVCEAGSVRVGDKRINSSSAIGSKSEISVGQGQKAVVMRIKKEWYEEDQLAKQIRVQEQENAIKQKALDGTYGKLEISRG